MKASIKMEPSALEISTLSNLGNMLKEFMPDWNVTYAYQMVPYEMRSFFLEGDIYTRATYSMCKYDKAFYVHVDFKETIEVYVIHYTNIKDITRRLYSVDRSDSLALFTIITNELTGVINGDFKGV